MRKVDQCTFLGDPMREAANDEERPDKAPVPVPDPAPAIVESPNTLL